MTACNTGVARTLPLAVHAVQARALVAALREAGITDDESVECSLESETGMTEAVGEAVRQLGEIEAQITGLQDRIGRLAARQHGLKARVERIRGALASALDLAGVRRVPTVEGTVYLIQRPPEIRVIDEAALPDAFLRTTTRTSPDVAAIKRALVAGEAVPGVLVSNGGVSVGVRP